MTLRTAFDEGHICPSSTSSSNFPSPYPTVLNIAMQALHDYRAQYGTLLFEVYFPFPLLLSQLVTLVVYSYFTVALLAQQNLASEPTFYIPVFTTMEFVVYIGALRVGQIFTNPLGTDESCFEMVAFFNRNLRLAHLYGGYGPSSKYDMISNPLPVVDLTERQAVNMSTIPLNFYSGDVARVPAGLGADGTRLRVRGGGGKSDSEELMKEMEDEAMDRPLL